MVALLYAREVQSVFVQAEDDIRDVAVTGVQTCALPIRAEIFFFQAEDGIRDVAVTGVSDVCSSDLADGILKKPFVPPEPLITMVKTLLDRSIAERMVAVPVAKAPVAVQVKTGRGTVTEAPTPDRKSVV